MMRALYDALELAVMELDTSNDPLAEDVRSLMDRVWQRLTDGDRADLNARGTT